MPVVCTMCTVHVKHSARRTVDLMHIFFDAVCMPSVSKPKQTIRRTFLREWREFRSLSQEKAADRLNIDRTTLSKIERALVPYNQVLLENAAEAYGCEPADLLMRDPNNAIWSIYDTLKGLPADAQEQVSKIVETFRKAS